MAKLILSMDSLVIQEIPLNKERITIGRKPHNDVQIDNLAVSGEHLVVVTVLNDTFIEDLNSTNGTFINGQSIKKHFLQNGDVVELGKYRLKYIKDAKEVSQQVATTDFEKTMVLRPGMAQKTVEKAESRSMGDTQVGIKAMAPPPRRAPQPAPAALPLGTIQVLSGANAGREMDLIKTLTTMGKPGVQVAVIARRPHGYFITHVEGANFPIVNGKTLDAQAHQLSDHDVIELAGVKMEFFIKA